MRLTVSSKIKRRTFLKWTITSLCLLVVAASGFLAVRGYPVPTKPRQEKEGAEWDTGPVVQVVRPQPGGMDRTTTQPGSAIAFESVQLYAAVSGYLKTLNVDIGSKVKKGEVLAVIEVPELLKQLQRQKAGVDQMNAKVLQMRASKTVAEAQLGAAKAKVKQAIANAKSAKAWVSFREKQLQRMQDLFASRSVEERLVDEAKEHYETAVESFNAAEETITGSKANQDASAARIILAAADIEAALAEVKVAEAELEKTQELVNYATISAPFDGVITKRTVFPGDFIRAATGGMSGPPLLTADRTDKLRVVVDVPDRDAPYADVGDEATIEVDALPGLLFKAPVARISEAEDPQTRMMRVEIDLPNSAGKLRHGMYGRVTIVLEKAINVFALPPSCVIHKTDKGKGEVFVVRDNKAILTPVILVGENEVNVGVRGLSASDDVILNPPPTLSNGARVTVGRKKQTSH
jgi:RND family efflux transporter MFP subunit